MDNMDNIKGILNLSLGPKTYNIDNPPNFIDLISLKKTIDDAIAALPTSDIIEPSQKDALIASCDKLRATLETPHDTVFRIVMGTHHHVATRLGVEMGIFDTMAGLTESSTVGQLASTVKADPHLVLRIMRVLAGMGFFTEERANEFKATALAEALVSGKPLSGVVIHFGLVGEVLDKLSYYYAENNYTNTTDATIGPFQWSAQTNLHFYQWLDNNPDQQAALRSLMKISRENRGEDWFDFYPVEERLQTNEFYRTLLVDIGGGLGHDITAFRSKYPELRGQCVLQDLPAVIQNISSSHPEIGAEIEYVGYCSFFDQQYIKGARAYFMRNVLHNWPNKQARQILRRIHQAMSGVSILLVNENVLPDSHVPLYQAELDLTMMALFASLERTEKQFQDLLDSVGFRLVKIWKPKDAVGTARLFEAVKK